MSDQFDDLFAGLRGQRPPAPFAPAAGVRRRGRQRAQRQAVFAGVAVLAVAALGAGGVVTVLGEPGPDPAPPPAATDPAPTPTPAPEPARTAVPEGWLLASGDLAGSGWEQTGNELLEGPWYWDGAQAWCPEYRLEDYPSVQQRRDLATVSWTRPGGDRVDQIVARFEPGAAAANLDDVRGYVSLCSRRPASGDEVAPTWYETVATGFAGDESLLLLVEQYMFDGDDRIVPVGEPHHVAVVRVGDAVTTIVHRGGGDVQELAARAAERLG